MMLMSVILSLLAGCAPPPIDTNPAIEITWPPPEASEMGCSIVTVDIRNFEVVDVATTSGLVAGQGHWHVFTPDKYTTCFAPYCIADFSAEVTTDVAGELTVGLVDNEHHDILDDEGRPITSSVLFNYVAGDCALTTVPETYP